MLQLTKLNSEPPSQRCENLWKSLHSVMWHRISWYKVINILEQPAASILRILCYHRFLWNVDNFLPQIYDVTSQKAVFCIVATMITSNLTYFNGQSFINSCVSLKNLMYYLMLTHSEGPCSSSTNQKEKNIHAGSISSVIYHLMAWIWILM
jgi:hypothetical protein